MVTPVTGPTQFSENLGTWYSKRGTRWRQAMPIDRPLPYEMRVGQMFSRTGTYANLAVSGLLSDQRLPLLDATSVAYSRAYARLVSKLKPSVELGAAIAEMASAYSMIAGRLAQIFNAMTALRRGRFGDFTKALGISKVRGWNSRRVRQNVAGTWLEYSFGWSPLISDVFGAFEVLGHDFGLRYRTARETVLWDSGPPGPIPWGQWTFERFAGGQRVSLSAALRVINPNVFLLNQMGLVNPVSVAWELVPFSFVADWFTNASVVISSHTDWLGCQLVNPSWTSTTKGVRTGETWYNHIKYGSFGMHTARQSRVLGLPGPAFRWTGFKVPGLTRAANQAATTSVLFDIVRKGR